MDSLEAIGQPIVHLDLGNFMSTQPDGKESRSRFLWSEMVRLNVRATTPGPRELREWSLFSEFLHEGTIPVVSSNLSLRTEDGEEQIGAKTLVVEENAIRLGLIGLIGAKEFANSRTPDGILLGYEDPTTAAATLVAELDGTVDLIVLLSQMSTHDTDLLLEEVPGIDVALYGHRAQNVPKAERLGDTIVNMTGSRGQFFGSLTLRLSPEGEILEFESDNGTLGKKIRKDPATLAAVTEIEAQIEEQRSAARTESAQELPGNTEYFLGAETCRRCHVSEYEQWAKTPHARAFATLSSNHGMTRTEDCTQCHVTGYDHASGYVPSNNSPNLENVQCEACHGPGTEHTRTNGKSKMPEATCTVCHVGEFAQNWNFEAYYKLVHHDPH